MNRWSCKLWSCCLLWASGEGGTGATWQHSGARSIRNHAVSCARRKASCGLFPPCFAGKEQIATEERMLYRPVVNSLGVIDRERAGKTNGHILICKPGSLSVGLYPSVPLPLCPHPCPPPVSCLLQYVGSCEKT